jgi:uncharacterized OB-fold protein
MKFTETITINPEDSDFLGLVHLLESLNGFEIEDFREYGVMHLSKEYCGELEYENVVKLINSKGFHPKTRFKILPSYDNDDYQKADFIVVFFSDYWLDSMETIKTKCNSCGRKNILPDYNFRVPHANPKKPFVNVNGEVPIFSYEVVQAFKRNNLKGAVFFPFDNEESYFYLKPDSEFSKMIVRENEALNLKGVCEECGRPFFDMFFGPCRYKKEEWNGDDFVMCPFHRFILFTPRAFEILKSFDKKIFLGPPAYLE